MTKKNWKERLKRLSCDYAKKIEARTSVYDQPDLLPAGQCYLKFPDGSIKLVKADSNGTDFEIIEELDQFKIDFLIDKVSLT